MNRTLAALCIAVGLGTASSASADPIAFADAFNPSDVLFDNSAAACSGVNGVTDTVSGQVSGQCGTLSFAFQLPGFDGALHSLSFATLTLFLYDDNIGPGASDAGAQPERFDLSVNAAPFADASVINEFSSDLSQFSVPFELKMVVQQDGTFSIVLSRDTGDFKFGSATLSAEWDRKPATDPQDPRDVPEPVSLVLLGAGLLAVGRQAKRRHTGAWLTT